ncbi:ABC transporter permease [Mycetocola tolaasinivorans]|uniref:ABC transporter permease n=1 Tax=Mycetocola tolaasinivorans TaxID=76635 RepID=A0A3L6ZZT1_9MICO|nr:ABC transporter permease [Mycetocola tolaasinivorans]RLP73210.1 ABC transporter permease [Mycetocola tolaasinivorans]
MTTITAPATTRRAPIRLSFAGLVQSEWIKLRSLRSTIWSFALMILLSAGIGLMMVSSFDTTSTDPEMFAMKPAQVVLIAAAGGTMVGQLIAGILGALVITGEYSTGMIRTTLTAAPKRTSAFLAKALVLFVSTLVVALVAAAASYLVVALVLMGRGQDAPLFDNDVLPHILGGAVYVAAVALFGLGLGTIIRSGAGAIAGTVGTLMVLPVVLQLIPADWVRDLFPYLLNSAGGRITGQMEDTAWTMGGDFLVVAAWVLVSLVLGLIALKRRDA